MTNILKLIHLNKSYGQNVVFQDVNCSIDAGHIVGLVGPNGCGKTVLLKIISGLCYGYDGAVLVNAQAPSFNTNKFVAYMPEENNLIDFSTIGKAVDYYNNFFEDFDSEMAHNLIFRFGLQPEDKLSSLSPGTIQRVKFLLTMSRRAKLYLLDDPFRHLDAAAKQALVEIILQLYSPESSILLSTQSIHECENLIDTILIMGNGKIMVNDNTDRLRLRAKKSVEQLFTEVFKC